jgi:hypothetical protein
MGKIEKNAVMNGFRGAIGENLVLRKLGKQTIFSRRAVVKKPRSEEQIANFNRFAEASLFATSETKKPEASLAYEIMAKLLGLKTAHHAAVSDFLSFPEIDSANLKKYNGQVGDVIGITPKVPYKVVRLDVRIHQADGTLVEEGVAVYDRLNWKYTATVANAQPSGSFLELTAWDRRGRKARFSFRKS